MGGPRVSLDVNDPTRVSFAWLAESALFFHVFQASGGRMRGGGGGGEGAGRVERVTRAERSSSKKSPLSL